MTIGRLPTLDLMRETFTPASIEQLVAAFYARVQSDDLLGPIFDDRVTDWEWHMDRMCSFWATVLRAEPGYHSDHRGSPQQIHQSIEGLTRKHYDRWLELFEATASDVFEPWAVDNVVNRARRIAVALSAGAP